MTARRFVSALSLVFGLLVASSAAAQARPEYQWTPYRPDAFAPTGVYGDHLMEAGQFMISYIFQNEYMDGTLTGTDSVGVDEIFDFWLVAPVNMSTQTHTIYGLLGVTETLTIEGQVGLTQKTMENWIPTAQADVYLFYETARQGIEDIKVSALWSILSEGPYRAHLNVGMSFPIGEVDSYDENPFSGGEEVYLGYPMQIGSGTFDFLPGFTVQIQDEEASVGLQAKGTIRIGEQMFDWSFGNRYMGTIWAAYRFNEYVSASARVEASTWGNIQGADPRLDPLFSPDSEPYRIGGTRADLPLGVNVYLPEGNLGGFRVSAEGVIPLHQNLEGPQLAHDWTVRLGIYRVFF